MDHFLNTYETKYNDAAHFYDSVKQYPASIVRWNHAIEVYTESGQLAGSASFDSNDVAWTGFQIDPNTKKYYFLKVIQSDGQYAITAPIWTGA